MFLCSTLRLAGFWPGCKGALCRLLVYFVCVQERASGKAVKQGEAEARLQEAEAALKQERKRLDELQVGKLMMIETLEGWIIYRN